METSQRQLLFPQKLKNHEDIDLTDCFEVGVKLMTTKFLIVRQLANGRKCCEDRILHNLHKQFNLDFSYAGMIMKISTQNIWCGGG